MGNAPWDKTFPEDHELIAFFEAEPETFDPDLPWFYQRLVFETVRDEVRVRCEISPSYGQLTLRLTLAGQDIVNTDIRHIVGARIECRAGREALLATVSQQGREDAFVLQLRPHVHVAWSNKEY